MASFNNKYIANKSLGPGIKHPFIKTALINITLFPFSSKAGKKLFNKYQEAKIYS
jgi:hypothetical protein